MSGAQVLMHSVAGKWLGSELHTEEGVQPILLTDEASDREAFQLQQVDHDVLQALQEVQNVRMVPSNMKASGTSKSMHCTCLPVQGE